MSTNPRNVHIQMLRRIFGPIRCLYFFYIRKWNSIFYLYKEGFVMFSVTFVNNFGHNRPIRRQYFCRHFFLSTFFCRQSSITLRKKNRNVSTKKNFVRLKKKIFFFIFFYFFFCLYLDIVYIRKFLFSRNFQRIILTPKILTCENF